MRPIKLTFFFMTLMLFSLANISAQNTEIDENWGASGFDYFRENLGLYTDNQIDTMVSAIGARLVLQLEKPKFTYRFYILDRPEPNALALPGGYIFITRGLLALMQNEAELATVTGHEIIHAQKRHAFKQQFTGVFSALLALPGYIIGGLGSSASATTLATPFLSGSELLNAQYSQYHEYQSDIQGIKVGANAGYNPLALRDILQRMSRYMALETEKEEEKSYFNSHPYTPHRAAKIERKSAQLNLSAALPLFKPDSFLYLLNGLVWGENPINGYRDSSTFYHPKTGFKIDMPKGWFSQSSPQNTTVFSPDSLRYISFSFVQDSASTSEQLMQAGGIGPFRIPDKSRKFSWNGYRGYMHSYNFDKNDTLYVKQVYVAKKDTSNSLIISSIFRADEQPMIESTLITADILLPKNMPAAPVHRILVVQAQVGESLASMVAAHAAEAHIAAICVLNDLEEETVFEQNRLVKLIIEETTNFE